MDIRGMQTCLAAILACPFGPGANQAHTGTTGVVVHLVVGVKESLDIFFGEEVRRTMRAVHHANIPVIVVVWYQVFGNSSKCRQVSRGMIQTQHVTHLQCTPGMPAKLPQGKGRATAHVLRDIKASLDRQVGAVPLAADAT